MNSGSEKSAKARHQRTWRRRRALGIVLLRVPAPEYRLIQTLLDSGYLSSPTDALNRRCVESAAARVFEDWISLWNAKKP